MPHWKTSCAAATPDRPFRARSVFFGLLASLSLFLSSPFRTQAAPPQISAQVYADKGFQHFYNLEFHLSAEAYRNAIELNRNDPTYWTGLADSYLFQMLMKAGRLDGALYTASNEFLEKPPLEPDAALTQSMWDALRTARNICAERFARNSKDAAAHYSMAVSYGIEANYYLNLARRNLDALSVSGAARDHARQALSSNPQFHDAKIVLGAYEYGIGSVPAAFRWLLALGGHTGSKERGVELIQEAMMKGERATPAAIALLGVIYSREQMFAYSRQMWQHMLRFFPRNHLAELEIARTYQRENNLGAAMETYRDVARKMEAGEPGFSRVNAERLHFELGTLLESKNRPGEALAHYAQVAALHNPGGILQARSYIRMGEIFLRLQQKEKAREMYQKAAALPFPDVRREANARLRTLK
jgi:tetratricopeptide (TPR) repeat protein